MNQCGLLKKISRKGKKGVKAQSHTFSSFATLLGISLRLCVEVHNAYVNDID